MTSTSTAKTKKRLGPDDFGYTFIGYEPPEGVVAAETATVAEEEGKDAETEEGKDAAGTRRAKTKKEEQDVLVDQKEDKFIYEPKRDPYLDSGGGDNGMGIGGGGSLAAIVLANLGAFCCCLFVLLILIGGILIAIEQYGGEEGSELLLAGVIVFILSACACLCGCVTLCVGCTVASVGSAVGPAVGDIGGGDSHDSKEVKVCLKRLNDKYEYAAEDDLNAVRRDVASDLIDIRK